MPGLCFLALAAYAPVGAQIPEGTLRLRKSQALAGEYLYWFVTGSGSASEPKPLPTENAGGVITLEVPDEYNKPGAEVKVLDVARKRMARLPLPSPGNPVVQAYAEAQLGPNLLRNGDFRSSEAWTLEKAAPAAGTLAFPDNVPPPPGATGRVARIQVTTLGPERWNIQFYQNSLKLAEGEPHTLSFWAKADQPRPLSLNVNVLAEDGHGVGLTPDLLPLTTEWKRFSFVFTPLRTVEGRNRVTFLLADALGTVDLAGVALRRGKVTRPDGPNLLRNGDFAAGEEGWIAETGPAPARAEVEFLDAGTGPAGVPGRVASVHIRDIDAAPWHIQLHQNGVDLADGQPYTLTFWAKADRPRPLILDATRDRGDGRHLGLNHRLTLGTTWRKYVLTFTPTRTESGHSRLNIIMGDAVGTVDLAGLSLQREVTPEEIRAREGVPLSGADFRYLQTLAVPVHYHDRPVFDVTVTMRRDDGTQARHRLQPSDRGMARFSDVPLNTEIAFSVEHGTRTARFTRTASFDAEETVDPIILPENWTDVRTLPSSDGRPTTHPLVGVWESRGGGKRYRFTFNADGTGSIRPVTSGAPSGAPRAPVSNPFRWYLKENGRQVVIGSTGYAWTITATGGGERLTLNERGGKSHVLYRR